jgi:hypothetical protein
MRAWKYISTYSSFRHNMEATVALHAQATYATGKAIAEAVSRWLPTAAARVQSRVWSSGICGEKIGAGAGFLRVLRFPLPFIPQILHPHSQPGQVQ